MIESSPRSSSSQEDGSCLEQHAIALRRLGVGAAPHFMPSFGLLVVNAGTLYATGYVEVYQHKSVDPNPSFLLDAHRDERWYAFFVGSSLFQVGNGPAGPSFRQAARRVREPAPVPFPVRRRVIRRAIGAELDGEALPLPG